MSRQYVFLVHGMGLHPKETWVASFKTTIHTVLQNYAPFKGMSAAEIEDEFLNFIPVSYDDIFQGFRNRTKDLTDAIGGGAGVGKTLASVFQKIADSAASDKGAENFFWTSALDSLLWQWFPLARDAVIARVILQVDQGLVQLNEEGPISRGHVIAHSLGTSVIHDSLVSMHYMSKDELLFKSDSYKWDSVSMVANVSRLLECSVLPSQTAPTGAFDVYQSSLKPGSNDSFCRKYLNFHHDGDPFTWPRAFSPKDWTDGYTDVTTSRYQELKTVHDFELYFSDPAVHIPILRAIFRTHDLCSADESKAAQQTFDDSHENHATDEFNSLHSLFSHDYDYKLSPAELAKFILRVYQELNK